jgi:hypothetical protein
MTTSSTLSAATGLYLGTFVAIHLVNHASMHWGLDAHRNWMTLFRRYYQHPLVEPTLAVAFVVHAGLAVKKMANSYYMKKKEGGLKQLFHWYDPAYLVHQLSGWYLLLTIPGHALVMRYMAGHSEMQSLDVTYAYAAAVFLPSVFVPNYALQALAGTIHLVSGSGRACRILAPHVSWVQTPIRGFKFWATVSVLGLISVSSALAVCGIYFPVTVEAGEWRAIVKSYASYWPKSLLQGA